MAIKIGKNAFASAKEKMADGGFNDVELEPGRYVGWVKDARTVAVKGKGDQIILDIMVPDQGGRVSIWYSPEEERLVWLLRDLVKLGYDVSDLEDGKELEAILEAIKEAKHVVKITATSKDGFTNYKINQLLADQTADEIDPKATDDTSGSAADKGAAGGKAGVKPDAHAKAGKKSAKVAAKKDDDEPQPTGGGDEPEAVAAKDDVVQIEVGLECNIEIGGKETKVKVIEVIEDEKKDVEVDGETVEVCRVMVKEVKGKGEYKVWSHKLTFG